MTKRPALVNVNMLKGGSVPEAHRAPPARRPGKDAVACTFKLSTEMYRKLQEIKIERGVTLQGLLEEAVDTWLASIGETGFKGRKKRPDDRL